MNKIFITAGLALTLSSCNLITKTPYHPKASQNQKRAPSSIEKTNTSLPLKLSDPRHPLFNNEMQFHNDCSRQAYQIWLSGLDEARDVYIKITHFDFRKAQDQWDKSYYDILVPYIGAYKPHTELYWDIPWSIPLDREEKLQEDINTDPIPERAETIKKLMAPVSESVSETKKAFMEAKDRYFNYPDYKPEKDCPKDVPT